MTKRDTDSDNWGQLLSDFGIEDQKSEEPVAPVDSAPEAAESLAEPKEKKSIFSRFPKISFFGAPPEVSLDTAAISGSAFIDNKLEKMPLSQEWSDRQEKNATANSDALTVVAAQIDVLASGEQPTKRQVTSMFDDPIPESEEFRTLKGIMGDSPSREESRRDTFSERDNDPWQRGRGRQPSQPPKEKESRGRGSRYKPPVEIDDLPESDFEPVDDVAPRTRGRGRRGSRYAEENYREQEPIQDDVPQEEWSEVDVALQEGRGEPVQRSGRRQRYDKRRGPERTERTGYDREPSDIEDSTVVAFHGEVPSWDDAIGEIISGNVIRHKNYAGNAGKGRR